MSRPWSVEAVGTAEWTGVPLRLLLDEVRKRLARQTCADSGSGGSGSLSASMMRLAIGRARS
ncbi:molybdopterin-dependent oxidoreductase [Streptomyces sp. 8N616]|uniref:molybdopterin-dependent oxidoreductase n=1 Tax=Streptomyces sp. 8N616 TaxID=3457414 RepID=UPI003FD6B55E